jgi:hypothetical protein
VALAAAAIEADHRMADADAVAAATAATHRATSFTGGPGLLVDDALRDRQDLRATAEG